jgi:dTDP-4-dehydrorhamnose reductase
MKRVLLLGGSGQLGTALRSALAGLEVTAPTHAEFDVTIGDADELVASYPCDVLIDCAALVNVDRCELEPEAAFAANAFAVDRLAAAAAKRHAAFMTISTDYVFGGDIGRPYREDDRPDPHTVYGASKLAGEFFARRHSDRHFIVRTSAVFGTVGTSNKGYTLIDKVLAQAERGEPTRMVVDMTFTPSYAPHVARAIRKLIAMSAFGTHHVTNTGSCTWYEFVWTAFAKAGLAEAPLEPITYASLENPTLRPMYSPLENTTFAPLGLESLPPWEDAVDEYLAVRGTLALAGRVQRTRATFRCNVCGAPIATVAYKDLNREGGTCPTCSSNVRIRAIAHLVSIALYGRSIAVPEWTSIDRTGYGVSDWPWFEPAFVRAFKYVNTQFDRERYPDALFLDIMNPAPTLIGTADIVTCSEVLEHVVPPVRRAFEGLYALLKPGGSLIFTVPYSLEETIEHFPDLHDWRFEDRGGRRILVNHTRDGGVQEFRDLCFHGGGDAVLEMRVFGLGDLQEHLAKAGFIDIEVMQSDVLQYGIRLEPWSRPIVARRPL